MKTHAVIAHPGHDHYKLDEKSGLWLPVALVGALIALAVLTYVVHARRVSR